MKISEEELLEIISKASAEGAKAAIKELKKQNKYREGMDTFQKTEYILRNYNAFRRAVAEREEQIRNIADYGIKKKSCSITSYPGGTRYVTDDLEKAEEQIAILQKENEVTKRMLARIDDILAGMQNEPYYQVIPMYYFDGKKYDVIGGELGISNATVSAHKKQFVNKIKIMMFSDTVIMELLEGCV